MNNILVFLLKLLIVSLVISWIIKYLAPLIDIAPSNVNALIIVMILPSIITVFLGWKLSQKFELRK